MNLTMMKICSSQKMRVSKVGQLASSNSSKNKSNRIQTSKESDLKIPKQRNLQQSRRNRRVKYNRKFTLAHNKKILHLSLTIMDF